jgi:RHH-type proline utilization regulon transcriptional repressor/proline dehydrogenase/delta 1-pyrroline-5-carboxylate dehydrogenase
MTMTQSRVAAEQPGMGRAELPGRFAAEYAPADEIVVPQLLRETAQDQASGERVAERARRYIQGIREARGGIGGLEDFMHDYSLSTKEGLALMSLAEALLRVPDAATQDRSSRTSSGPATGSTPAARESESWLVSARPWALGLTRRIPCIPPETPGSR